MYQYLELFTRHLFKNIQYRGGGGSGPVVRDLNRKVGTCSDNYIAIHSATGLNAMGPQRILMFHVTVAVAC